MPPPFHKQVSFSIPGLNLGRVSISPLHKVSHGASNILDDATHVLYPLMQRRYENVLDRQRHWKQEGLRLVVTGNSMGKTCKRVVRNWSRRRIERTMAQQLRERGYDERGWRLNGTLARTPSRKPQESQHVQNHVPENEGSPTLRGAVTIMLSEHVTRMKYSEVQRQAGLVADEVLRRCQ